MEVVYYDKNKQQSHLNLFFAKARGEIFQKRI
jgi:hypothetical protein